MNVLVACEFSGIVRDAFLAAGHYALSCDLLPTEQEGPHYQGDVLDIIDLDWDLMIAHPPCTYIANSGNKHYAGTKLRREAAEFVHLLWQAPINRVCIENPVGQINSYLPDMPKPQWIHPWQYGHMETKRTGLWKRNLSNLIPTNIVGPPPGNPEEKKRWERVFRMAPGPNRGRERSRFYTGIAEAMAQQWGG